MAYQQQELKMEVSREENELELYDYIIVGGGLSGLVVASKMSQWNNDQRHCQKLKFVLLEASSKFGGRLCNDAKGFEIDMGGAWIWIDHQPRMKALVDELGIKIFPQPGDRSEHDGSVRCEGGAYSIIQGLLKSIPAHHLKCDSVVMGLTKNEESKIISVSFAFQNSKLLSIVKTKSVIITSPPKVNVDRILFDPPLSREKMMSMHSCNTWMAGVTKVTLIYPRRFWPRNGKMCNIAMSNYDPEKENYAFQMYDASNIDDKVIALTCFTLCPEKPLVGTSFTAEDDVRLAEKCARQIKGEWSTRSFKGISFLQSYIDFYVKRWPIEDYVSENKTPSTIQSHPRPDFNLAVSEWGGQLHFAGTESDLKSPGVMEGAVNSALRITESIL